MTRRTYITPDRIVLSLAGFEAAPGMPLDQMLFDSNWPSTALILAKGIYFDPQSGPTHVIGIPTFSYPIRFLASDIGTVNGDPLVRTVLVGGWTIYPGQAQKARLNPKENFAWAIVRD
ncbi:MAG: hypothetical protein V7704_19445 [Aurantimonas endophytica]|uniref:hypothetical protein n=1 Tax=Aurantimonas endophytica TaxID=1522175 RepID=UPI0030031C3D